MAMLPDPGSWDDAELARRCAAREEAAWRECLRRSVPAAQAMMQRVFARAGMPQPEREAEEAVGDLVAALLEKDAALLRAFRPGASLRAYLAVIGRSLALRKLQRRGRSLPLPRDVAVPDLPEQAPVRIEEGLAGIPSRDRLLLRLVYWDGLSYAEAARILGVPPGSMGPLLTQARAALRRVLEENT